MNTKGGNRELLAAYIAAEKACRAATGRVSDRWMDKLVDRASATRKAFFGHSVTSDDDAMAWVDFAHAWVTFNAGSEMDPVVARILEIEASAA